MVRGVFSKLLFIKVTQRVSSHVELFACLDKCLCYCRHPGLSLDTVIKILFQSIVLDPFALLLDPEQSQACRRALEEVAVL